MTLSVYEGAVADPSGNGIAQTTIPVDVTDGIPPTLVSSSYNTGTGILRMAFSEPLGPTIHYDRMHIRDTGRSTGGLTLDDIASRTLDANTTITLTLSEYPAPDHQRDEPAGAGHRGGRRHQHIRRYDIGRPRPAHHRNRRDTAHRRLGRLQHRHGRPQHNLQRAAGPYHRLFGGARHRHRRQRISG